MINPFTHKPVDGMSSQHMWYTTVHLHMPVHDQSEGSEFMDDSLRTVEQPFMGGAENDAPSIPENGL